jgi:hypothetical protein
MIGLGVRKRISYIFAILLQSLNEMASFVQTWHLVQLLKLHAT